MNNTQLLKAGLIFGGGFLVFLLLKPLIPSASASTPALPPSGTSSSGFDSSKQSVNMDDANIVCNAYAAAVQAGEPTSQMTELNKELMNEFGMRCYVDTDGKLVVCDIKGNTILKK